MIVFIEYDMGSGHWKYYYYDSKNFRSTTDGFENHILAREHATDVLGVDIEIKYK